MGTGQPNVNATSLKELKCSIPPLNEQKHIVAKVDQLMTLCNHLEQNLKKSDSKSENLFNAVVNALQAA